MNIPLVQVNCARCGSWESEELIRAPDYELHVDIQFAVSMCRECAHIYTSIRPDYQTLFTRFYADNYMCYGAKTGSRIVDFINRTRIETQARQRAQFARKYLGGQEPVRLLEVGCATGEFLRVCRQRFDWEVTGIEPNRNLSDALRQGGFQAVPSTLEEAALPAEGYDIVCLFNVLEHLWDPIYSLKRVNQSLMPGGIVVAELPTFDSWTRRFFGKYWFLYHLPRHLSHFTRKSLTSAMAECGFEKVDILQQFRPTVNILSFQYMVHDKIHLPLVRGFCSSRNPLMLLAGVPFESLQYVTGNANTITGVFRKVDAVLGMPSSILQERSFEQCSDNSRLS